MASTDPILAQLEKEVSAYETKLKELRSQQTARMAYLGLAMPAKSQGKAVPLAPKVKAVAPRKRAPKGQLQEAIWKVMQDGVARSNMETREALAKAGYGHSTNQFQVSKMLTGMARAGRFSVNKVGTRVEYLLAKAPAPVTP